MGWTREKVYELICQSKRSCTLGLFIGSGFSKAVTNSAMPSWDELLRRVARIMSVDDSVFEQGDPYPTIASVICKKYSSTHEGTSYKEAVQLFKYHVANEVNSPVSDEQKGRFSNFASLSPNWIVTTNYDFIIETLLKDLTLPINPDSSYIKTGDFIPVYHIHGSVADPSSIVITNDDYAQTLRISDYRHARLPFLIKESTVLMIGYSLNDLNVISAVDYSKNVYTHKQPYYDTPIIQLLYSRDPKPEPYVTDLGIVVMEISDICEFLREFVEYDVEYQSRIREIQEKAKKRIEFFNDANIRVVHEFCNNPGFRLKVITKINEMTCEYWYIYSSYVSFINRCLGDLWIKAYQPKAFSYYRDILCVILDLIEHTDYDNIPIPYADSLVDWFCDISPYVGRARGQSYEAMNLFENKQDNIPDAFIQEFEKRSYISEKHSIARKLLEKRIHNENAGDMPTD